MFFNSFFLNDTAPLVIYTYCHPLTRLDSLPIPFRAVSDSLVMRGLRAVILQMYEGKRPDQIVRHDSGAVDTLILTLAPSRASGLRSLKQRIRESAEAAL